MSRNAQFVDIKFIYCLIYRLHLHILAPCQKRLKIRSLRIRLYWIKRCTNRQNQQCGDRMKISHATDDSTQTITLASRGFHLQAYSERTDRCGNFMLKVEVHFIHETLQYNSDL